MKGQIVNFGSRGFGFIESADLDNIVFFHVNSNPSLLEPRRGNQVEFDLRIEAKGYVAYNCKLAASENHEKTIDDELAEALQLHLAEAISRKVKILLLGRTGVGKSSTINSLLGSEVSLVGHHAATTRSVEIFEKKICEISFIVVDTPGLCDDVIEAGNDLRYLDEIKEKASDADLIWFTTPITDSRVRVDEILAIKSITEQLGVEIWQNAIVVLTFADPWNEKYREINQYESYLNGRVEELKKNFKKFIPTSMVESMPFIPVSNLSRVTPDDSHWLGKLFTSVFVKLKDRAMVPFLIATSSRLVDEEKKTSTVQHEAAHQTSQFVNKVENVENQTIIIDNSSKTVIQERMEKSSDPVAHLLLETLKDGDNPAIIGGAIGAVLGFLGGPPVAMIGAVVGVAIGKFIGSFFRKKGAKEKETP